MGSRQIGPRHLNTMYATAAQQYAVCYANFGLVCYTMVQHSTVWYGTVWYGILQYGMVCYSMVQDEAVWHGMMLEHLNTHAYAKQVQLLLLTTWFI